MMRWLWGLFSCGRPFRGGERGERRGGCLRQTLLDIRFSFFSSWVLLVQAVILA
jgi:hypothetical protein